MERLQKIPSHPSIPCRSSDGSPTVSCLLHINFHCSMPNCFYVSSLPFPFSCPTHTVLMTGLSCFHSIWTIHFHCVLVTMVRMSYFIGILETCHMEGWASTRLALSPELPYITCYWPMWKGVHVKNDKGRYQHLYLSFCYNGYNAHEYIVCLK